MTADENGKAKALLDRIVAMLTKLGQRGYFIHEEATEYFSNKVDTDSDTASDSDDSQWKNKEKSCQQIISPNGETPQVNLGNNVFYERE